MPRTNSSESTIKSPSRIFIGIGGNIGDTQKEIYHAYSTLSTCLSSVQISSLYRTLPRDDTNQEPFINAVIQAETTMKEDVLLELLQQIEKESGRVRNPERPKGPRTLDLDLLLYGDSIIRTQVLTVPHPRMHLRKFVLVPLLELSPHHKDPLTGSPYAEMMYNLENQGIYFLTMNEYSGSLSWGDKRIFNGNTGGNGSTGTE